MKIVPVERTKLVPVTYWCCGLYDHQHKTKESALRCIDARDRAKKIAGRRTAIKWGIDECYAVLKSYRSGIKISQIARDIGLSYQSARLIILRAERLEKAEKEGDFLTTEFTSRTANLLRSVGVVTVNDAIEANKNGLLNGVSGAGSFVVNELRAWADLKKNGG